MLFKKRNCSNCRVGMESLKLDIHSEICPYIVNLKNDKCRFYKPLEKEKKFLARGFKDALFKAKK